MEIKKGQCIGIKGQMVQQKYFTDILMGLLKPTNGQFLIDGTIYIKEMIIFMNNGSTTLVMYLS